MCGRWAHLELLRLGARIEVFLHCVGPSADPSADPSDDLVLRLAGVAEAAYAITPRTAARLQPDAGAGALLSLARIPRWDASVLQRPGADLVLVADGIGYAGNLGTLIRTADGCGAAAVVLTGATARITHRRVFLASRGTVLTLPVLVRPDAGRAREELEWLGFRCHVADPAAALAYHQADFRHGRTAVVVGSERTGVGAGWRTPDLARISIPMLGRADSLNVAVSAAVLLAEVRRQRAPG